LQRVTPAAHRAANPVRTLAKIVLPGGALWLKLGLELLKRSA
jgi:hypothetical protein